MRVQKRRRREFKTDYLRRIKLLKSEKPRIVFRKTNRYLISQYVTSKEAQDKIEIETNSKELLEKGWPKEFEGSLKSISAAYLTGFLTAKKILEGKKELPVVDLGMTRTIHKTKGFAFIKGLIEGGLKISCKEEAFPEQDRIEGKSLKKDFSKIFSEIKSKIEQK
jgi:large subunit ribosomal protein L18